MKNIYLIRHAQSESNAGLAVRPNADICLTNLGRQQADELADWLMGHVPTPRQVFVSSYVRTHQTAEPYLERIGAVPVVIEPLREFNYLDFERIKTLPFADIAVVADEFWAKDDPCYADGEMTDSFDNLVMRVRQVRQQFDALPDGDYVVFTHGMWLGMLMWQLVHGDGERVRQVHTFRQFELAVRPSNCDVFLLQSVAGKTGISKVRVR